MYDLIFLVTMTLVSPNHKTLESCQAAIRKIYVQQVDPYKAIPLADLEKIVNIQMEFDAPRKYQCVKKVDK